MITTYTLKIQVNLEDLVESYKFKNNYHNIPENVEDMLVEEINTSLLHSGVNVLEIKEEE